MNENEAVQLIYENVMGVRNYIRSPRNQETLSVEVPAEILGDVLGELGSLSPDRFSAEAIEILIAGFGVLYEAVAYVGQVTKAWVVYKLHREFLPDMRTQNPAYGMLLDVTMAEEKQITTDYFNVYVASVETFDKILREYKRKYATT